MDKRACLHVSTFNFKLSAQSLTKLNLAEALAVIGGQAST
jgi:hypothetical protein